MHRRIALILPILVFRLFAQEEAGSEAVMKHILERLDGLEKENQELIQEVRNLRKELDSSRAAKSIVPDSNQTEKPSLEERVSVEEQRTAEQAQTKVEASHKFPIQLDGMLLFNAFANSTYKPTESPSDYGLLTGPSRSGATLRQTLLGLELLGPSLPGGGRVNGSLMMDFWAGYPDPGSNWLRLRRADVSLDWTNRSFSVGQDKPLISPRQPDSLAEVGIPPLAGSGNLWLWLPQARYEERLHFGANSGITGQLAVIQTKEDYATIPSAYSGFVEKARPGLEGRFAFWHSFDDTRKFEFAPGFHISTSRVAGNPVKSRIGSLDWLVVPASHLKFSGTVFSGQDVAGLGALGNGFTIDSYGRALPIKSSGGWAQIALPVTNRLTFNFSSGLENNRADYMNPSATVRNWTYASNLMYRLGSNVIFSLEGLQIRTRLFSGQNEIHNHYDLTLAYLF